MLAAGRTDLVLCDECCDPLDVDPERVGAGGPHYHPDCHPGQLSLVDATQVQVPL